MLMIALDTFFFAIGLGMYGFVSAYWLFAVGMAILTIGEMVTVPIANAVATAFTPEVMCGCYSFIYGNSWDIAFAIGPYLAGQIMDNYDPNLLWYTCAIKESDTCHTHQAKNGRTISQHKQKSRASDHPAPILHSLLSIADHDSICGKAAIRISAPDERYPVSCFQIG